MRHYKCKFKKIIFHNRWKSNKTFRSEKWLIFGLYTWYAAPNIFYYKLGLFGFELLLRFEKIPKEPIH